MDFGKVAHAQGIDFKLPKIHKQSLNVLSNAHTTERFQVNLGLASWTDSNLIGNLYPRNTKQKKLLQAYGKRFNSIELNATHYRIFSKEQIHRWKSEIEDGFIFCPKLYQGITHHKKLIESEALTDSFIEQIYGLGNALGSVFMQLPPSFQINKSNDLIRYVLSWPKDIPLWIEFRHPSFFEESTENDELWEFLSKNGNGIIITDVAGRRDVMHLRLTIPKLFLRFQTYGFRDYDKKRMVDWGEKIKQLNAMGLNELFMFLHEEDPSLIPEIVRFTESVFQDNLEIVFPKGEEPPQYPTSISLF